MSDEMPAPNEPVPGELRILASEENLGELRSVHRPATFLARLAFRRSRIYLYRNGFVLANARGRLGLFRFDQVTATRRGSARSVQRPDGATFLLLDRHWTESGALAGAIDEQVTG
jgi:hypothetical protein